MNVCCQGKLPVDRLREGDRVRAVAHGPIGVVEDADRLGWTIVRYRVRGAHRREPNAGVLGYKHGQDRLYLVESAR